MNGIVIVEGRDLAYLRVDLTDPTVHRLRVHIEPDGLVKFKTNEGMWSAGVGRWDVPPSEVTLAGLDGHKSERGFTQFSPINSVDGGYIRAFESSRADGPHIRITAIAPSDLNDPDSERVQAAIHLQLEDAVRLRDQLTYLVEHHYQLR